MPMENGGADNGSADYELDLMLLERPFDEEALCAPFPRELIKQRQGSFGGMLDYIEWNKAVERVNTVTDNRWSCRIDWSRKCQSEEKIDPETGEVLTYPPYWAALVTVSIPSMGNRSQVGTCAIQGDEVDCLKAAISDGLKKCLTLFGVGLHLYEEGDGNGRKVPRAPGPPAATRRVAQGPPRRSAGTRRSGTTTATATATAPPEPATEAQQRAVFAISQQANFTPEHLRDIIRETYGVEVVEELSKKDASAFIDWLQQQLG